jgi:excisionase family DNA binding protein
MAILGRKTNEEPAERTIDISAQMQGSLCFKDSVNLKINGQFTGTLEMKGTLTIGNEATVEAHITGENIIIGGKVKGDIIAKKMLVLMPTANLVGNISTPKLNIVEGAIFRGQCQMVDDLLSTEDLARYLELEPGTVIELANNGGIPAQRSGNEWVFERSKIDSWASTAKIK